MRCFEEKCTQTKLGLLDSKNLYNLALSVARTQQLDASSVADIHRQYGDHLYTKGDYDGSMQQFVKTIGYLQPSYVIRKVREAQAICLDLLTHSTVPRCATNTQPCHLPPRPAFAWISQLRTYHPSSQHIYQAQGCLTTGQLHQDRVAYAIRWRCRFL